MKEIKACVRRGRVANVVSAIRKSPAWRHAVKCDEQKPTIAVMSSALPVAMYRVECVCDDAGDDALVGLIRAASRTGEPNAGWVTVSPLVQAVPV